MRVLSGIAISPGLGRGKAWFLTDTLLEPIVDETPDRINSSTEKQRLAVALAEVKAELELAARQISQQLSEDFAEIFRIHGMMLDGFLLSGEFGSEVEASDVTAEAAVRRVFQHWEAKFLRLLVPMVTLASDMKAMRSLFEEVVSLESNSSPPPLGAMIETPAAALDLEELCPLCDFFSIGSNDLTQYTLAAARENPDVNDYYQEAHPAVLRLLRMIVESAGVKPVTLCGELAGREDVIPQLVSMGLRALSVAPIQIPAVKQQIRTLSHS